MITYVDCGLTDTLLTLILTDEHLPESENAPLAMRKVKLLNPERCPALKGDFFLDGTMYHFTKAEDDDRITWSIEGPTMNSCGACETRRGEGPGSDSKQPPQIKNCCRM